MIPRRRFLYLRHGETDWNAQGRAQGLSDVPLNERGRDQARDAARVLATAGVARIVASPLSRAHETATIVGEALGLSVVIDAALHEVSFGRSEGEVMGAWYEDWLEGLSTPPGGESFAALSDRGAVAVARQLDEAGDLGPVLFVAHGALFRGIRRALGQTIHVRLANGAPVECCPEPGGWNIHTLPGDNKNDPSPT